MRILVCGSRTFDNYPRLRSVLDTFPIREIISGGACGADTMAADYASRSRCDIPLSVVTADWDNDGKSAGIKRNLKMLDMSPDIVIAFWDGESPGTKHTITEAAKRKISTLLVYF